MTAGQSEYRRYLTSMRWRLISRSRRKWDKVCRGCAAKDGLQVHHASYRFLGRFWIFGILAEWMDTITLCGVCHEKIHSGRSITEFAD